MTVYNLNMPIYRNFRDRLFPKLEHRKYCLLLQDAERDCRAKNYNQHPPCQEIAKFIQKMDCYSLSERPLYPVKESIKK